MATRTDFYIYKHTFSNGIVYIGKGTGDRCCKYQGRNDYYTKLFNKYGKPDIEILYDGLTESESFSIEVAEIAILRLNSIPNCNITIGGEGASGYKHKESSKIRISESGKGLRTGDSNGNYNDSVYRFSHKDYGIVDTTIYGLNKTYNVVRSGIYRIINGDRKTANGFSFIHKIIK